MSALFMMLILCISSGLLNAAEKPVIEVIHSDAHTITGIDHLKQQGFKVTPYNLDQPKRLIARFAQNLPPNQDAAKKKLEQRFQTIGKSKVQQQFQSAYQALIVATQYGINRYPAIVFNHGQAVIYGITDLTQALNRYRQWQRGQQR